MHNPIKTEPLSLTLMLNGSLAAELVSGDPAAMWPGLKFDEQPVGGDPQLLYLVEVKGRLRYGEIYTYDNLRVTEWRVRAPKANRRDVPLSELLTTLSTMQIDNAVNWLKARSINAWARASEEVRDSLGKAEPFYSVAEASRRASIPITTLDSAVRSVPQRVPAARDDRGMYCVRMSALNKALKVGRVRSGVIKRRRTTKAK